jgi:phosphate transport system permease protein
VQHRRGWEIAVEKVIEALIRTCGVSAIVFVFGIFFFVFREGAGFLFSKFNPLEFFGSIEWYPSSESHVRYGVLALIAGTASVTALAMALAVPFGVGAAIFISEFCRPRAKETLKVVIELLAAIPSVVWGFIALSVMNPLIMRIFHVPIGLNVLNGGVILALMSVPIIVSIGEDALKAVPDSYRRWSIACSCQRRRTGCSPPRSSASAARSGRRWPC